MVQHISFTKTKVRELQIMYDKAVSNNVDTFIFDGKEFLTSYAKYLLEYLKGEVQWKKIKR
jgi:hypothetical protein